MGVPPMLHGRDAHATKTRLLTHPLRLVPILVLVVLAASGALAQQEQWLQYRSATEAWQIVADLGYQLVQPATARPQGVKFPTFTSERPLVFEWKTPMVAGGRLWMAFDQSGPQSGYDRLYLDANANGDLSDDPACLPYRRDGNIAFFGPVKIVFPSLEGPITYHLGLDLRTSPAQTCCHPAPSCWYEGQITVGGVKRRCLLIDHNVNGTFNDRSLNYHQSDRIRIGEQAGFEGGAVGKYVEVDSKLYQLEVARDGACVTLVEAGDVPRGTVRLAEGIASVVANGENGSYLRRPEKGVITLPAGEYRADSWVLAKADSAGAKWEARGTLPSGGTGSFTVAPGKEANPPLGEPISSTIQVSKEGSTYVFEQRLEGPQGERVVLARNGSRLPPPKLHIHNQDGTFDRRISFEYG